MPFFRNTGEQEIEQADTNPHSTTFGTKRWLLSGTNTTACPVTTANPTEFRSAEIAETVYRNNCTGSDFPNGVTYRLAAGYYVSTFSQTDADQHARTYYDQQKQAYANANDTCSPSNVTPYTCINDVNGCWSGYITYTATGITEVYTTSEQYDTCYILQTDATGPLQTCPAI